MALAQDAISNTSPAAEKRIGFLIEASIGFLVGRSLAFLT
jgi:hypothetical protein